MYRYISVVLVATLIAGCVVTPVSSPGEMPYTQFTAEPEARSSQEMMRQGEERVQPVQEGRVPIKMLTSGSRWPSAQGPTFALITGPNSWTTFLRRHGTRPDAWPPVDWNTYVVLVALMGQQRTGGYSIAIRQVRVQGNTVIIQVKEERPAPGEMVIQVLTSPYYIGLVARDTLPPGPLTLYFVTAGRRWQVDVTSLVEDRVYTARPIEGPVEEQKTE